MPVSSAHKKEFFSRSALATILVVDDEKAIRDLCEKALNGYHVLQAGTCEEAISACQKEEIDLVLTDVKMPGMGTGLDLLRHLKERDPNITVIVMTGFVEKKVILSALQDGADDFVNKPLNMLQLTTAIEKSLARKALREELAALKKLDHLKSVFLSTISHKLRTPITSISLFLQNIQRGVYSLQDADFAESLSQIHEETEYLSQMVTDLLAFSRVIEGSEQLHREPCELNGLLTTLLFESRKTLKKTGIDADFQEVPLLPLQLDKEKITFALRQIIDNAYKFSGDSGSVSVTLQAGTDDVCIMIADNGIGMPRDEVAKAFEKFYQVDPYNTGQVRGFGLGLYYAREFVRQHGGHISLDSSPGMGTTVTVTLPVQ